MIETKYTRLMLNLKNGVQWNKKLYKQIYREYKEDLTGDAPETVGEAHTLTHTRTGLSLQYLAPKNTIWCCVSIFGVSDSYSK